MTAFLPLPLAFRRLGPHLLGAALVAAGAMAVAAAASHFHQQASHELERARQEKNALLHLQENTFQEDEKLQAASRQYEALKARGVIGKGQRAQWTEVLQHIRTQQRLDTLHYTLSAQHPLPVPMPHGAPEPFRFLATDVHLTLVASHEGKLLGALEALDRQLPALIQPRRCVMEKLPPSQPEAPPPAHVRLVCHMDWIVIEPQS